MLTLLAGSLIAVAMTGLGLLFCRLLKTPFDFPAERLVFSAAAGTALTSYAVFFAGSAGILNPALWATALVLAAAISLPAVAGEFRKIRVHGWTEGLPAGAGICVWISGAVVLLTAFGTAAPETGHDALSYHLVQPLRYLREGRIFEVPYSTHTLWPSLMQMLFTLGLLLKDASLAKFFHFFLYLCTATGLYAFARAFLDRKTAFFAPAVYLTVPGFYIQASFSYVDNALACFSFFAFYALYRFLKTGSFPWAFLSGAFSGFALSVKLIGLFVLFPAGVFFLAALVFSRGPGRGRVLKGILLFSAGLLIFGSLWYIRSAVLRGNPVFPFYPDFFGGQGWHDPTYVEAHGRGQGPAEFLLLLWDLTLHPAWFGGEHIGPVYLAFLPLLLGIRPLPPAVKAPLLFGGGYAVLWFLTDQNVRFFYPVLTFFTIGAAAGICFYLDTCGKTFRAGAMAAVIFVLGLQSVFAVRHFAGEAVYFFKPDSHAYLLGHERSYAAARAFDSDLSPSDRILSAGEVRGFYFKSFFVQEGEFHLFTAYDKGIADPAGLSAYLKSLGFTHVLLAEVDPGYGSTQGPRRVYRMIRDNPAAAPFFSRVRELDFPEHKAHYSLFKINA